jgi:ligand-binding sensor domain-containing protein
MTLAFFACAATAGAQQYSFQYYGVDQGLTNLAVRSLFQDTKGFLWLSTESGIFRYDGARFQSYGEKDGIPSSNAAVFGEAPDGSLLVGSNSGLYRLTANQFQQVTMPGAAKVSFGAGIQSDGKGRSYIATDGGLVAMTRTGGTNQLKLELLQTPPHLGDSTAYGVLAEKDSVWWGCGDELCIAEGGKTRIFGKSLGLSPSKWKGIIRGGNGDLWVQSKSGRIAVMRRGKSAFEIPDLPLSRFGPKGLLSVDKGGRVLVPVGEGLVIQEDNHWRQIDRRSGLLGPVYAILQDREGSSGLAYPATALPGGSDMVRGSTSIPIAALAAIWCTRCCQCLAGRFGRVRTPVCFLAGELVETGAGEGKQTLEIPRSIASGRTGREGFGWGLRATAPRASKLKPDA